MNPTLLNIPILIIKEQELVIGPLAWEEARKVTGLNIDYSNKTVTFSGDANEIINNLVAQYERLFGQASREVCRESVQDILKSMSSAEIPTSLK